MVKYKIFFNFILTNQKHIIMIESVPFYLLRVDECYTFGNRIAGLLTNFDLDALQLSVLCDKFRKSLSLLDASLVKESTRSYTLKVLDTDKNRDDSFLALRYYVQASARRRNAVFREAATLLSDTITSCGWRLYNESLSKESSRLNNLISDLENKHSLKMAVTTLGLQEWFNELKQAQVEFEAAQQERTLAKASVNQIKSEDACMAVRRDCEIVSFCSDTSI